MDTIPGTPQPVTMALGKFTVAAGTTTTLSTTGTQAYTIRSKAYSRTALTNQASPTTDAATGAAFIGVLANFGCVFLIGLNAAGSLQCVQGTIVPLDSSGNFINAPNFGALPLDFCPIAYLVIKAGSTANATTGWIFGTSNNSSVTGITYTFVDVTQVPDRPQIA